ncbi:MAG TPA: 5-formyltetrahydrofolate cyclo-ligase [Anaeromyxobacteraceae bacterium]|nr:5-formyltetrahydrofolate cyclo-ligase [Anaeromyxobacteraceae bacterium]
METKDALRARLIAARRALSEADRARASDAIAARLVALEAFRSARAVGLYAPLGAEVDTAAIARAAEAAGKRVAWPRLAPSDRAMAFALCPPDALRPGPARALEPPAAAPACPIAEVDLVVVPGVAFDAEGRRLGRGRGHYDATLRSLRPGAACVGLAFEAQLVPALPEEPHDARVDAVVTEARIVFPLTRRPGGGIPSRP